MRIESRHIDQFEKWWRVQNQKPTTLKNLINAVEESTNYKAFGAKRLINVAKEDDSPLISKRTTRGFTGHEHLDQVTLIHMNAHLYDPELGRFISPDTVIPDVSNPQAINRYTYVYNNPLSLTDPSGNMPYGAGVFWTTTQISNGTEELNATSAQTSMDKSRYDGVKHAASITASVEQNAVSGSSTSAASFPVGLTANQYLQAVENNIWQTSVPIIEGFSGNKEVDSAAARISSLESTSSGNVISDPRYIQFLKVTAKAIAKAKLPRKIGDAEKFIALALNQQGEVVVTNMPIFLGQGGNVTKFVDDSWAGAIAHVHYRGLIQPPIGGDHSVVKFRGISSFVIGHRGEKIWEVGRINGAYMTRSVNGKEPGSWSDY